LDAVLLPPPRLLLWTCSRLSIEDCDPQHWRRIAQERILLSMVVFSVQPRRLCLVNSVLEISLVQSTA